MATSVLQVESPVWNIFSPPIEDTSIESYEWKEYKEKNINVQNTNKFELIIQDLSEWIYPTDGFLHVIADVRKTDGTAFNAVPGNVTIALNNSAWNWFIELRLKINNSEVEFIQFPGITDVVMNSVEYSLDHVATTATNQFFFPDTGDGGVVTDITAFNFNEGFTNRLLRTLADQDLTSDPRIIDRQISVWLPIKRIFRFLSAHQKVWRGAKISIEMRRNQDVGDLFFRNAGTPDGKLIINDISLWVPILKASPGIETRLRSQLTGGKNLKTVLWNETRSYKSNVFLQAETNPKFVIPSTGAKPVMIFIVMQLAGDLNDQTKNNMIFKNFTTTFSRLRLDRKKFPEEEYESSFVSATEDYSRLYMEYLKAGLNQHDLDSGAVVNYQQFKDLYPIFVFDLTSQDAELFRNVTKMEIEVEFKLTATGNYVMWAIVMQEKEVDITGTNDLISVNVV